MTSYHNTTHSTGAELAGYENKANSQECRILDWFYVTGPFCNELEGFSPSQIQRGILPNAPITSIRRAMTNLTNRKKLKKTKTQRMGPYGRPEYVWKLATNQLELI